MVKLGTKSSVTDTRTRMNRSSSLEQRYKPFVIVGRYFNDTNNWAVIVGALATNSAGTQLFAKDTNATPYDSVLIGVTPNDLLMMPRRILIPPGASIDAQISGSTNFLVIECASLEDALAIL